MSSKFDLDKYYTPSTTVDKCVAIVRDVVGVGKQYTQHTPNKQAYDEHHDFTDAIRSLCTLLRQVYSG